MTEILENSKRKRAAIIFTVALGIILNPLNTSSISLALVRIQGEFGVTFRQLAWFISLYYLVSAIANPIMGRLSDLYGRKRYFLFGLALVFMASALAPYSSNLTMLTVCRAIQAWGCSTVFPAGYGIVRAEITSDQARALGSLAIFANTAAAFGPSFGGFLLNSWDWPVVFYINLPLVVGTFILAYKVIPKDTTGQKQQKVSLDYLGSLLFSLCIIFTMLFLMSIGRSIAIVYMLVTGILFGLFYTYEKKQADPFVNIGEIVKNKGVGLVYLAFLLLNIVFYAVLFGFPSFLQQVWSYSPAEAGFIMLALAGFSTLVSPYTGKVIDSSGLKIPLIAGVTCLVLGSLGLLGVVFLASTTFYIAVLAVIGISSGVLNLALQAALYCFVPTEETGSATGLFMTSRFTGTIFSSSLLGILFDQIINYRQFSLLAVVCLAIAVVVLLLVIHLNRLIKIGP